MNTFVMVRVAVVLGLRANQTEMDHLMEAVLVVVGIIVIQAQAVAVLLLLDTP